MKCQITMPDLIIPNNIPVLNRIPEFIYTINNKSTIWEFQLLLSLELRDNIGVAIQKFWEYINKNYYGLPRSYSAPSPSE
jgi:hypothetical protein